MYGLPQAGAMEAIMLTVNQLSKVSGVSPHAIRYYSRMGILQPVRDPQNDYRLYAQRDVNRLRFIRHAQSLGLTLSEIGELIDRLEAGRPLSERVRELLLAHLKDNEKKLRELKTLQSRIDKTLRVWQPGSLKDAESFCRSLASVNKEPASCRDLGVSAEVG